MVRYLNSTTRSDLNAYFLRTSLWPAVVYTTILMLIGTVGNIMVIYVYRRQFRRSVTRMFIYALAILDLGNCLITMPAELMILIQFTTFPSPAWCKASRYLTYTFNGTSSIILITIALDRYFKVCRPTQSFITMKRARVICPVAFLFTAACSIPALVLYGEITLPLLVTNKDVTILPVINGYTNGSILSSDSDGIPSYVYLPRIPGVTESSTIVQTESRGRPAVVLYGSFCLLNSHYIDSEQPLLFYFGMFFMYIVMVILVVFFYSKVARAMFVLTRKHSKLFTFYGHNNNSTPASNSGVPEGGGENIYFSRPGSKVVIDLGYQQGPRYDCSFTDSCDQLDEEDHDQTHCNVSPEKAVDEVKDSSSTPQTGNGETGYDTDDANSTTGQNPQVYPSDPTKNPEGVGEATELLHKNGSYSQKHTPVNNKSVTQMSPKSKSLDDVGISSQSTSLKQASTSNPFKRSSRKKSEKKVPKIKVDNASSKGSDLNISHQYPGADIPFSLSSNSLLLRRIKSAENVNSLSRLYKLQVPEGQKRNRKFPDKDSDTHVRGGTQKRSRRENVAGIGNISKSDVDLTVVRQTGDETDGHNPQKDLLTLTKNSLKSKKQLYVIPLTGLSTKTAIQIQDSRRGVKSEEILYTDSNLDVSEGQDIMKSSHSIYSEGDSSAKGTPLNGSSSNLIDSIVTLRSKSPQSALPENQGKGSSRGKRTPASDKSHPTPRQQIVSTADILQERHQRGSLHPIRTSRMLFTISLVFVISFLPFFTIALIRSSMGSSFMTSLSDAELGLVSVFIRSSLLSNAVNPIVYGLLSTHFRRECTGIMCCIFKC